MKWLDINIHPGFLKIYGRCVVATEHIDSTPNLLSDSVKVHYSESSYVKEKEKTSMTIAKLFYSMKTVRKRSYNTNRDIHLNHKVHLLQNESNSPHLKHGTNMKIY